MTFWKSDIEFGYSCAAISTGSRCCSIPSMVRRNVSLCWYPL